METGNLVSGLAHIGLPTDDMAKTLEFYEGLGFEIVMETVNEAADEKVAFVRFKGVMLEIYENKQAAMKADAIDHIAFDVTDVRAVFESLKAGGYELLDDKVQFLPFWDNGVEFFTILGPNKEKLEFCQKL